MKKILAMGLALSMCAVPFTAFAEEEVTPESLMEAMEEYSQSVTSMSMPMTMNLNTSLSVASEDAPETAFDILLNGGFDVKYILNPMTMSMNGEFEVSAMGMNEGMSMEMYMTSSEDGSTIDSYVNMIAADEESGWQHTTMDMTELFAAFGVSSMEELNSMSVEDLLGMDSLLEWTVEETDSTYELSSQLLFSDLMPIIEDSMGLAGEELGEEEMAIVESLLGAFTMNMSYSLDKETKAALTAHIDFNDSDLTVINQLINMFMSYDSESEEGTTTETTLTLNDFSMDMTYTYDDVEEIVVPEEALNAETIDANDVLEELE